MQDMTFPHTQEANGYTSLLKSEITTKVVTNHGEDRKLKPHQVEGYQLRWKKPCQDKHEEKDLHHTRVHQDATIEDTHSRQKLSRSHQRNNIRKTRWT